MEKVDIDKSEFLCKYVDEMVSAMHRMYPEMSKKDIEKLVRKKVSKDHNLNVQSLEAVKTFGPFSLIVFLYPGLKISEFTLSVCPTSLVIG